MIFRVESRREADDAMAISYGGYSNFHQFGNLVEIDVAFECGCCRWVGFERDRVAADDAGRQDRVAADVGTDIGEKVAGRRKCSTKAISANSCRPA